MINDLQRQVAFIEEIEQLKSIQRANRTLDGRQENAAEHSWHVALMALLLADHAQGDVDLLKVVKMLLIHDLVEIDAGDTWLFAEDQASKHAKEEAAAERLFSMLPEMQAKEYAALWFEFEERQSAEARFAAVMDGLQPLINHLLTGSPDDPSLPVAKVWGKKGFIQSFTPGLWELVEQLVTEGVERGLYH